MDTNPPSLYARCRSVLAPFRRRYARAKRLLTGERFREYLRHELLPARRLHRFVVVSSVRNAEDSAATCLDSVYNQNYRRSLLHHIYIDDNSTDQTEAVVTEWLNRHPDHNVTYCRRRERVGGTINNLVGLRAAPPGSIVVELNGDDWLPDARTVSFLNKVYHDPDVWITYNTARFADGRNNSQYQPFPEEIVRENAFRRASHWMSGHLHSFRQELFTHLREESMIDPLTGDFWENADDQALYYPLFEMAGQRARHIHRTMYIYNLRAYSDQNVDGENQVDRARRIRQMPPYQPLDRLAPSDEISHWRHPKLLANELPSITQPRHERSLHAA